MGRSKNTGNITVVLYEDPPDQIPKIHVRSRKYMAWIAESGMPVHLHVDKVRPTKNELSPDPELTSVCLFRAALYSLISGELFTSQSSEFAISPRSHPAASTKNQLTPAATPQPQHPHPRQQKEEKLAKKAKNLLN